MSSKSKRPKKLKKKLKQQFNVDKTPPFDAQAPTTSWIERPDLQQKRLYVTNMADNCMRSILFSVLVQEGLENCSDEELSKWLIKHDIYDESQAALYCIQYLGI